MPDGLDWPMNVADCTDCGRRFCGMCEWPEPGRCKRCSGRLCGTCYAEAVRERRAVCAHCAVPKRDDADLYTDPRPIWERY